MYSSKLERLEAELHLRCDDHPVLPPYLLYSYSDIGPTSVVLWRTPAFGLRIPRNGTHARLCRDPNICMVTLMQRRTCGKYITLCGVTTASRFYDMAEYAFLSSDTLLLCGRQGRGNAEIL